MRPSSIMQFMSKATGVVPSSVVPPGVVPPGVVPPGVVPPGVVPPGVVPPGVSARAGGMAAGTRPTAIPAPKKESSVPFAQNLIQGNSGVMQSAPFSSSGPDTLVNGGADFFAKTNTTSTGKRPATEILDNAERTPTPAKRPCLEGRASDVRQRNETRLNEATRAYLAEVQRLHREDIAAVHRKLEQIEEEHNAFFEGEPVEAPHLAAKRSGILFQKKRNLEKKMQQLEQWSPLAEAQETVRTYLMRHSSANEAECAAIVQDFVGRYCEKSSPVHRCNTMLCPTCQIPMNIMHDDGFLLCVRCLATQVHTERTSFNGQSGGDDADIHLISNKRESNFRDFLHLLQGKKLNPALEAKMPLIAKSLGHLVPSWSSFALCSSTVQSAIVENLTTLGLRKFSKYVVLIESRLRKIPVPAIPLQIENRLCTMFLIIVDPYERHKPASRKHFISYAYCAWQFCRIEKIPHHLPYFRLLKDEKKIMQQDHVFKQVCDELSWEFASPISHGYHTNN